MLHVPNALKYSYIQGFFNCPQEYTKNMRNTLAFIPHIPYNSFENIKTNTKMNKYMRTWAMLQGYAPQQPIIAVDQYGDPIAIETAHA